MEDTQTEKGRQTDCPVDEYSPDALIETFYVYDNPAPAKPRKRQMPTESCDYCYRRRRLRRFDVDGGWSDICRQCANASGADWSQME